MEQSTPQVRVNQVVGNPYNRTEPVDKCHVVLPWRKGYGCVKAPPGATYARVQTLGVGHRMGFSAPIAEFTMVRTGDPDCAVFATREGPEARMQYYPAPRSCRLLDRGKKSSCTRVDHIEAD